MSLNYYNTPTSIVKIVSYISDGILMYCDRIFRVSHVQEVFEEICRRISFHQSINALGTLFPANSVPFSFSAYLAIRFLYTTDKYLFIQAFREYERNQQFMLSQANQIIQMHQNMHFPTLVEVPIVHTYAERFDNIIIHEMQIKREFIQIPTQVRIHSSPLHYNGSEININWNTNILPFEGQGLGPMDLSMPRQF